MSRPWRTRPGCRPRQFLHPGCRELDKHGPRRRRGAARGRGERDDGRSGGPAAEQAGGRSRRFPGLLGEARTRTPVAECRRRSTEVTGRRSPDAGHRTPPDAGHRRTSGIQTLLVFAAGRNLSMRMRQSVGAFTVAPRRSGAGSLRRAPRQGAARLLRCAAALRVTRGPASAAELSWREGGLPAADRAGARRVAC